MPKRKKPKLSAKKQHALFLETAKAVQAEDAGERFEKACAKILKREKKT
ncbi:MAG TPA: hypothetical protein VMT62_16165 [Syntrophorhabdaceae bacterium]|nr:hypothetical protein [Syntrophorhabdaceae bacterium]